MGKETLSPKQASLIMEEVREILNNCQTGAGNSIRDFIGVLVKNWADKNAVELGKQIGNVFTDICDTVKINHKKFNDALGSIAREYERVGGMTGFVMDLPLDERLSEEAVIGVLMGLNAIKDHFPDGDTFGFMDVNQSPDDITAAFDTLKKDLQNTASYATEAIKKINAFGNESVQLNLANSAGAIVTILQKSIVALHKSLNETLDKAKNAYKTAGENSASSARLTTTE